MVGPPSEIGRNNDPTTLPKAERSHANRYPKALEALVD